MTTNASRTSQQQLKYIVVALGNASHQRWEQTRSNFKCCLELRVLKGNRTYTYDSTFFWKNQERTLNLCTVRIRAFSPSGVDNLLLQTKSLFRFGFRLTHGNRRKRLSENRSTKIDFWNLCNEIQNLK